MAIAACNFPKSKVQLIMLLCSLLVLLVLYTLHMSASSGVLKSLKRPADDQKRPADVEEIARLRAHLRQRPKLLNAAICLLVQRQRVEMLKTGLRKLHDNFNTHFEYPVILFHEADFYSLRSDLRSLYNTIFFQQVDMQPPAWATLQFGNRMPEMCPWSSAGYRNMCRFHTKLFYEQPVVRGLDFYWRLDDDSELGAPFAADPFRALRDAGAEYGFLQGVLDSPLCTHDLWKAAKTYMTQRGLSAPTFFNRIPADYCFFNNFEVASTRFWMSEEYRRFADYIDRLGGIYRYRWGDAPIKTLALSIFMPPEKIVRFTDVRYIHGNPSVPPRVKAKVLNRTVSVQASSGGKNFLFSLPNALVPATHAHMER